MGHKSYGTGRSGVETRGFSQREWPLGEDNADGVSHTRSASRESGAVQNRLGTFGATGNRQKKCNRRRAGGHCGVSELDSRGDGDG